MIVEFWSFFFACERCGLSPEKKTAELQPAPFSSAWFNVKWKTDDASERCSHMCDVCLVCSREHVRWSRCVTSCRLSEKFLTCFEPPSTQRWENNGDVFFVSLSLSSRSLMKFIKLHNFTTFSLSCADEVEWSLRHGSRRVWPPLHRWKWNDSLTELVKSHDAVVFEANNYLTAKILEKIF